MNFMQKVTLPEGKKGDWSIKKFTVPKEPNIEMMRLAMSGRSIRPGEYTKLTHKKRGVIMSDTPAEMADHYDFVRMAKGHCLINGLGLGMCVKAALSKSDVTKVTVIEMEQDVIDLVSPHYTDDRLTIICADAMEYRPRKGDRFGAVWHDIWDTISQDNYEQMKTLHRRYGRYADWQGSWGRPEIERMNREDREWRRWYA